jgi:hypothetical protein
VDVSFSDTVDSVAQIDKEILKATEIRNLMPAWAVSSVLRRDGLLCQLAAVGAAKWGADTTGIGSSVSLIAC